MPNDKYYAAHRDEILAGRAARVAALSPEELAAKREYHRIRSAKWRAAHREQYLQSARDWRAANQDKIKVSRDKNRKRDNAKARAKKRALKIETFNTYGGCFCVSCGEIELNTLSIDHIDGGGNKHRKALKDQYGGHFYQFLKRNGFPPGYRVLCMSCQYLARYEKLPIDRPLLLELLAAGCSEDARGAA